MQSKRSTARYEVTPYQLFNMVTYCSLSFCCYHQHYRNDSYICRYLKNERRNSRLSNCLQIMMRHTIIFVLMNISTSILNDENLLHQDWHEYCLLLSFAHHFCHLANSEEIQQVQEYSFYSAESLRHSSESLLTRLED